MTTSRSKNWNTKKRLAQERNWNIYVLMGMLKVLELMQWGYGRQMHLSTFGAREQIRHLINRTKKQYDKELAK